MGNEKNPFGGAVALLACAAFLLAAVPGAAQSNPGVPQTVELTAGAEKLTLTWQAPSSWGSLSASHFEIDWRIGTSGDWIQLHSQDAGKIEPGPTATSYTFTGNYRSAVVGGHNQYHTVTSGTTYQLRIRAVSANSNDERVSGWVTLSGTPQQTQSSNANLSGLTASSSTSGSGTFAALTLAPPFAASSTSYTATVANSQTHAKLTPTVAHSAATVTVKGTTVTSGTASSAIALSVGSNAITVQVTAQDSATKDYTVTITRQAAQSSNANLSALTASSSTSASGTFTGLTIAPTFSASTTSYTATVANSQTHAKLTPTVAHSAATVTVRGTTVTSGAASSAISLSVGSNAITVQVTAQDSTTKNYTVTITRQAAQSSNANLSALTASSSTSASGTFTGLTIAPAFSASTTSYTATVPNATTHAKLTPTVAHSAATVAVRGTTVTSGAASSAIALSVGSNAITVQVTAQDSTTKNYTVTITRQAQGAPPAVHLTASPNPVLEGSAVTVTATMSEALSSQLVIPLTLTDNTAESGDHGSLTSITIAANATSGTGTISTNQDTDEDDETFTVALGTLPSGVTAGTPSSVTITISDDDETYALGVVAIPACGTTVTDMSVQPHLHLTLTPRPTAEVETQVRIVETNAGPWLDSAVIGTSGRSSHARNPFAHMRETTPGFAGWEFRLKTNTGVRRQCTWQFDDGGTTTPTTRDDTNDDGGTTTPTTRDDDDDGGTPTTTTRDDDGGGGGGGGTPTTRDDDDDDDGTFSRLRQLALWTHEPAYLPGETVRLYHSLLGVGRYRAFVWLEPARGGQRRYLAPLSADAALHDSAVDIWGRPEPSAQARSLPRTDKALAFEGLAPDPGLWRFVLELRHADPAQTRRAYAPFTVAERNQLLNRRDFDRELRSDLTLRNDTRYFMLHQLFVHDGATLTIEPGTVVEAFGPHAAIIVEPGGSLIAEGIREAPVVLTCSLPVGQRSPGCWGGVRILGRAPVTRLEGLAPGVLPADRPVYGGTDADGFSGRLRYLRVEFAGASGDPQAPAPAIGLFGAGSATLLDHVQARDSSGAGIAFSGGSARCDHCVANGSGAAGLAWQRGWQGSAAHLYVQHGPGGTDAIHGAGDDQGHDRQPRSLPTLSNLTLVHSAGGPGGSREGLALRLSAGSGVTARDLLATGFGAGAIRAGVRAIQLFEDGQSSVASALLYRNGDAPGRAQLHRGLNAGIEFINKNPLLRDVRWVANPDPRPRADSPALPAAGEGYIGAFGKDANWLEQWTVFGAESSYDTRNTEDSP